jgi:hypothetical protein
MKDNYTDSMTDQFSYGYLERLNERSTSSRQDPYHHLRLKLIEELKNDQTTKDNDHSRTDP